MKNLCSRVILYMECFLVEGFMGFIESCSLAKILNKVQVVLIIGDAYANLCIPVVEYVIPVSPFIVGVIVDHIVDQCVQYDGYVEVFAFKVHEVLTHIRREIGVVLEAACSEKFLGIALGYAVIV